MSDPTYIYMQDIYILHIFYKNSARRRNILSRCVPSSMICFVLKRLPQCQQNNMYLSIYANVDIILLRRYFIYYKKQSTYTRGFLTSYIKDILSG